MKLEVILCISAAFFLGLMWGLYWRTYFPAGVLRVTRRGNPAPSPSAHADDARGAGPLVACVCYGGMLDGHAFATPLGTAWVRWRDSETGEIFEYLPMQRSEAHSGRWVFGFSKSLRPVLPNSQP